jgi:hypothetical protein
MQLAIIVPFRDRHEHAKEFIPYMSTYLTMQGHDFHILIVEQESGLPFNRGKLCNIGYNSIEADYYVFHDIDMLPITADYSPCLSPTHLVASATQFDNGIPYETYFGGVTMFPNADFMRVNGFSNEFWGWGSEDDDLIKRCANENLVITRREGGTFKSLDHAINIDSTLAKANWERYAKGTSDGLTTLKFTPLYKKILTSKVSILHVSI